MATSGSKVFNFPVDSIIRESIRKVGGEWTNADEQSAARDSLNLVMLDLLNREAPLGSIKDFTVSVGTSDGTFAVENGTLGVLNAYITTSSKDVTLGRMSFIEYRQFNDKEVSKKPTSFTTEVSAQQLKIKLWPINDTTPRSLTYTAIVQPDVVTRNTQELDIMNRYLPAVTAGLAYEIGLKRKGIATERLTILKQDFEEKLQRAFDADKERSSVFVRPRIRKSYNY